MPPTNGILELAQVLSEISDSLLLDELHEAFRVRAVTGKLGTA
jgi:hypothetical protein